MSRFFPATNDESSMTDAPSKTPVRVAVRTDAAQSLPSTIELPLAKKPLLDLTNAVPFNFPALALPTPTHCREASPTHGRDASPTRCCIFCDGDDKLVECDHCEEGCVCTRPTGPSTQSNPKRSPSAQSSH
jgi:hypothetical protein